jgi:hypothetical protein
MVDVHLLHHNFDFVPGKNFVQKKSPRLLLREAVPRADNKPSPVQGRHLCRNRIPKHFQAPSGAAYSV